MDKWEYLTLRAYQGQVVQLNGLDPGRGGKRRPLYPEYLNVLGREGWEVVGFALDEPSQEGITPIEVILKREVVL